MFDVAVVGGGLAGLVAAYRLSSRGLRIAVLEAEEVPGGLAGTFRLGNARLEKFYHHLFTTDREYVKLAEELGLGERIHWLPSKMGIWARGKLWDFGTPAALLKFKPLSMPNKIRFAASTFLLSRVKHPHRFENITAKQWLSKHQGKAVWETVWGPLFNQKFGVYADRVAMVWLWGKIRLRGRSRNRSGMGELLGYMEGSFGTMIDELVSKITANRSQVLLTAKVERIRKTEKGFALEGQGNTLLAKKVLVTVPLPKFVALAEGLITESEKRSIEAMLYTSAVCMVLVLRRKFTSYYWLNIADAELPFGGLIEHTNYVPSSWYGGKQVLYISNYVAPDDPRLQMGVDELLEFYLPGLKRIRPDFEMGDVLEAYRFAAEYAQPVVTPGYKNLIPPMETSVPGLYLCTMGQIYPEDRGQNYAVLYAERAAGIIGDSFQNGTVT